MEPRIFRTSPDTYALHLLDEEREVLGAVIRELRVLLTSDDPGLLRLFPPAYANDPERNAEYIALVHDELLERRLAALDTVETTLHTTELDEQELSRWMGAVNDLRLVLGTRLDVTEDMDEMDPDDELAPGFALYQYLTWLLDQIVDALADD